LVPVCITPEVEEDEIQMLIDVLEEDSQDTPRLDSVQSVPVGDETKVDTRPRRPPSRPQRYQSGEVERQEKELRKHTM